MSDNLNLPTVPEATAEDPEDVSWALSTAEAMWARGDHADGIKWVRRAAEAASEAENDSRALELAKAAADLTTLIARMSRTSVDADEVVPDSEPVPPPAPPARRPPPPPKPPVVTSGPSSVTKQVTTPSRPPPSLPSRMSQPPPGSIPPKGKPLGTNTKPPPARPAMKGAEPKMSEKTADKDKTSKSDKADKKSARRSRDNLEAEARAVVDPPATDRDVASLAAKDVAKAPAPNVANGGAASGTNVVAARTDQDSMAEWDAASTQNLTGDELPGPRRTNDGDRMTAVSPAPSARSTGTGAGTGALDLRSTLESTRTKAAAPAPTSQSSPPATVVGAMLPQSLAAANAPSHTPTGPGSRTSAEPHPPHDPGLVTSQAVRVVVWRDGSGVHVAPAGTVVSAITVEAVLVALEPNADLTAWLSQRKG